MCVGCKLWKRTIQVSHRWGQIAIKLVCNRDKAFRKKYERACQLNEDCCSEPDSQREKSCRSNRCCSERGCNNADSDKQSGSDTYCGGDILAIIQNGFPRLADFVQPFSDAPNFRKKQSGRNS